MVLYCIPCSPPSYRQYSIILQGRLGISALQFLCFRLKAVNFLSITHFHSFLHSQSIYLAVSLPLYPLAPYIRPSSSLLALTLMHSQSGCPLSECVQHVHQAIQRPACRWAQIAADCKLLEISLEGERECKARVCVGEKWGESVSLSILCKWKTRETSITKD